MININRKISKSTTTYPLKSSRYCKQLSYAILPVLILVWLSGCSSLPGTKVADQVQPIIAEKEMTDNELLDVSIHIFEPGELPEDENKKRGLSEKIRLAEARYIPIHLKYTIQNSGFWGNVRVVPADDLGSDVSIKGKIEQSDGESIVINIDVHDAKNRLWFNKTYKETVKLEEQDETEPEKKDIFQDLYYEISNDLIRYRLALDADKIKKIQQTADLRFSSNMAPDAFSQYLQLDDKGQYQIMRLPAKDDPMLKRLQLIQARHEMMVDTVNRFYDNYYTELWENYDNWRRYRSEELEAIRVIERKALAQKILGTAAIVGAIALGASSNSDIRYQTSALRGLMVAGGAYAVYSGMQTGKEVNINKEAIEELGESFATDAEPLVIDVEGKTIRLTGTAEEQYAQWRQMLKNIYAQEIGY